MAGGATGQRPKAGKVSVGIAEDWGGHTWGGDGDGND